MPPQKGPPIKTQNIFNFAMTLKKIDLQQNCSSKSAIPLFFLALIADLLSFNRSKGACSKNRIQAQPQPIAAPDGPKTRLVEKFIDGGAWCRCAQITLPPSVVQEQLQAAFL